MPKRAAAQVDLKLTVVPDRLDLRDRPYMPAIAVAPTPRLQPPMPLPVLDQGDTNACTGFALATAANLLLRQCRGPTEPAVSPFMLYSMARRYDEFPGLKADTGSSLRGAMKGWFRHGVCRDSLWKTGLDMPPATKKAAADWWLDAAHRPLGAYYRVDTRSVTDMHVALQEVGVLYASAVVHDGWYEGFSGKPKRGYWSIPVQHARPDDGGHAFVILGYTEQGFIIQNSWGAGWGSRGLAVLSYEDWLDHAMDCWVAQLGVVTELHREIAEATTLRSKAGVVQLASQDILRDRELSPFIVDMENNGVLSSSGRFRTGVGDLESLVTIHLEQARKRWGLKDRQPTDVAIYAHGGLTGEDTAAETAAKWIPALYDQQVFPIFLMWETDLWSTLKGRFQDLILGLPKPTGGLSDWLRRIWDRRLERLLAPLGTAIWGEMKQNADAITGGENSGGQLLYRCAQESPWFTRTPVRLHLIGHSAGAILHSHMIERLGKLGWSFESVNFMAPAVTVDLFEEKVLPRLRDGSVKVLNQFHLTDSAEVQDHTCRAILGYSRSLLYLVSESFEGGKTEEILGMQKHFDEATARWKLKNVRAWTAPQACTGSTTHGGFDDDAATMASVLRLIKTGGLG